MKDVILAKKNYQFEKRQRDLAKKKKQEEKRLKKLQKVDSLETAAEDVDSEAEINPEETAQAAAEEKDL